MQLPTILLTDQERTALSSELEKLFTLQDKHMGKEKLGIFVDEIEKSGIHIAAVMAGIRSLLNEDLKSIKLNTIMEASRKFVEYDEFEAQRCDSCGKRGLMFMRDAERYQFAVRCTCFNANRWSAHGLRQWDGNNTMLLNGRLLTVE